MSEQTYLRDRDGQIIGPVSDLAIGVLFGARIIDESTPISGNGADYVRLDESPAIFRRAEHARTEMLEGRDPSLSGPGASSQGALMLSESSAVEQWFRQALAKAKGTLAFSHDDGEVRLSLLDGKVVAVSTDVARLGVGAFLAEAGVVSAEDVEVAEESMERFGGDLGGALIGLGLVPPHVYVERYSEWSKRLLGEVVRWTEGTGAFEAGEVKPPAIPLGLDRFGALAEVARKALDRQTLTERLAQRWNNPVIPSSVDGVSVEDLRLPPKDLRIVKNLDGTRPLAEVVEKAASDTALATLYLMFEMGFARSGEDVNRPKELEEAKRLGAEMAAMKKKSPLEVLGVKAESTDEEVRARFMVLAKQYHPDGLRPGAIPELVEARRNIFATLQSVHESIDTPQKRDEFRVLASMGVATKAEEQAIVRAVLEAETNFKKAEILIKMRKYGEAAELLDLAIAKKPDDVEFQIHRAYLKQLMGRVDHDTAIREINELLKKQKNVLTGPLFLARLYKAKGDVESAIKEYKRVLKQDEKNREAESEVRLHTMRQEKANKKKWPL